MPTESSGAVSAGGYRTVAAQQHRIQQMIIVTAEYRKRRAYRLNCVDHRTQVTNAVDGVFDANDILVLQSQTRHGFRG